MLLCGSNGVGNTKIAIEDLAKEDCVQFIEGCKRFETVVVLVARLVIAFVSSIV